MFAPFVRIRFREARGAGIGSVRKKVFAERSP
jgi:hypothetical protein